MARRQTNNESAIGMFDSGFGGLTVTRAVIDLLPNENLIYLGDNARYPYGPRPLEQVKEFTLEIAEYLVKERAVKALVVACNTATAAALPELRNQFSVPVLGVIEPGIRALAQASETNRVGVIGTIGTVASGEYQRVMSGIDRDLDLQAYACPGFVEFVERGIVSGPRVTILAERLLAPVIADDIDALLLGCTHYPYLARVISDVMGRDTALISSADETAFALKDLLEELEMENKSAKAGSVSFISSGDAKQFIEIGSQFLGPELQTIESWIPRNDL